MMSYNYTIKRATNNQPEIYPPLEDGSYRPAYKSVAQWQLKKKQL